MITRIKFRIHGGARPGKFAFNVPVGSKLILSALFRPIAAGEAPAYALWIEGSRTKITFYQITTWNGKTVPAGVYEVRMGHIFSTEGITVEILECPELAGIPGKETTQFLDLAALVQDTAPSSSGIESSLAANPYPQKAAPALTLESASGELAPEGRESSFAEITPTSTEEPDKLVIPLSFEEKAAPEPSTEVKEPATQKKADAVDPIYARNVVLKKSALIACGFMGMIFMANQLAQRYTFDIDAPEPVIKFVQIPVHANRKNTANPVPVAAVSPASIIEPLPVLPPMEADRAPASSEAPVPAPLDSPAPPSDQERGAKLAAIGKDLMGAVEEGNLKVVKKLIETDGASPDFTVDDLGRSPFLRAAAAGRVSVLQYLVTKKIALTAIDYNGNNALMWSAINGHEKTAAYLLTLGLDPGAKREDGKTALALAKQYRQKAIVSLLNRGTASVSRKK